MRLIKDHINAFFIHRYVHASKLLLIFTFRYFIMSTHNVSLRSILEANRLTGPNFIDWLRNLRIVLRSEKISYVLDGPIPPEPAAEAAEDEQNAEALQNERNAYNKHIEDNETETCVMLASISPELQKQHEHMDAPTILFHLKELFDEQSRNERYEISRALFRCKMAEGSSVAQHGLKMNGYIERLEALGFVMEHELSVGNRNTNNNKDECSGKLKKILIPIQRIVVHQLNRLK